jgi:Fe-S-cluster containining protein
MNLGPIQLPAGKSSQGVLPPLYARWMDELLQGGIPREARATCDECVMCSKGTAGSSESKYFYNPDTKCCTFIPSLPNYLVGNVLSDDNPDMTRGKESVKARIASRVMLVPAGLHLSPAQTTLYSLVSVQKAFGRNDAVRCPHFVSEGGMCGIHRHRNSVCATWFCKYERGRTGADFWADLFTLLQHLESELSMWCLLQLGLDGRDVGVMRMDKMEKTLEGRVDGVLPLHEQGRLWGPWLGKEEEFFIRCGELVRGLSFEQVLSHCGATARLYARRCQDAYGDLLKAEIPRHLVPGNVKVHSIHDTSIGVEAFSPNDPRAIPRAFFDVLHEFDGKTPTETVVANVELRAGVVLERDFLQQMVDLQVLVRSPDQPTPVTEDSKRSPRKTTRVRRSRTSR